MIELAVLIIVISAGLIGISIYLKRSLQGRLRGVADDIGEQYSPTHTFSNTTVSAEVDTTTIIEVEGKDTEAKSTATTNTDETQTRTSTERVTGYEDEKLFP